MACWLTCQMNCVDFLLTSPQKSLTPKISGGRFKKYILNGCLATLTIMHFLGISPLPNCRLHFSFNWGV